MLMQQDSGIALNGQREDNFFWQNIVLVFARLILKAIKNVFSFSDSDADILR